MKRLFLALVALSLIIAACGSSDAGESPAVDEASLIETKVASTVAAALGDDAANATVEIAPTAPAISGDATPLTPIPRLEEPSAEVSPEVEYADEGRQDGQLTFDFGGGATAVPQVTATVASAPTPLPRLSSGIGGTVFTDFESGEAAIAYTLTTTELTDSMTDDYGNVTEAREGYRLLLAALEARNVSTQPVTVSTLHNNAGYLSAFVVDRDQDQFRCTKVNGDIDNSGLFPPGYGITFRLYCEIPVTANAEELSGLVLMSGAYDYPVHIFEFDLGQRVSATATFDPLLEPMTPYTLPVSNADLCNQEIESPYVIESASWYDSPAAGPDEGTLALVAKRYDSFRLPWLGLTANSPEHAVAELTAQWGQMWGAYDFDTLDLVAIRITLTNSTKADLGLAWSSESFALVDQNRFAPSRFVGHVGNTDRLVNPWDFLDSRYIPPGVTHQSTLYALVPETAESATLLHQVTCFNSGSASWYRLVIPRASFAEMSDTLSSNVATSAETGNDNLTIAATTPRTMTAVVVDQGQQVTIRHVDGQWQPGPSPNWPPVGPQGDSRIPEKATFPKPDAPLMALAFGVEGSATVFVFEENPTTFVAPAAGRLWFGPNDDGFDDNAGELVISISLE